MSIAEEWKTTYVGELVLTQNIDGLVHLQLEDIRLKKAQRSTVDLDQTSTLLDEGHSSGGFLLNKIKQESTNAKKYSAKVRCWLSLRSWTEQQHTFLPKVCTLSVMVDISIFNVWERTAELPLLRKWWSNSPAVGEQHHKRWWPEDDMEIGRKSEGKVGKRFRNVQRPSAPVSSWQQQAVPSM